MFFFFITLLSLLGRRLIGDWSAISRGPVPDRSATSCIKSQRDPHEVADQSPISRRPVPDQSPTSRRPTAKPSCDSSATSAIVMNFGRGEVAERLQCMSDLGLRLLKMVVDEVLCKRTPYFRSFLTKATSNHRTVGGYMSFIWLSCRHVGYMSGYKWL